MSTGQRRVAYLLAMVVLGPGLCVPSAHAQRAPDAQGRAATPVAQSSFDFGVLLGRWVRPDGGYVITIRAAEANGKLDASYANPRPLPFEKAEVARVGSTVKVFLELRAGGYNGSTYTLTHDPVNDVLKGVYYQAVAGQSYDVYFVRAR